jgi:putative ABC transport system permease protein
VVVVNREFVRRTFATEDAIGQYIDLGWTTNGERRGGTIVGVVGDVKQSGVNAPPPPTLYLPLAQAPLPSLRVVLRTTVVPSSVTSAARSAVRETDAELPIFAVKVMEEYLSGSIGAERFYALLVALFAGVALTLATVGLYGVTAYAVSQQTHELGVRVALGATGQRITRMVVGRGLTLTLAGLTAGVLAALLVSRVLRTLLFGVSASDPFTFAAVAGLLVTVAGLASYVPARRAARVDPLVAMRGE